MALVGPYIMALRGFVGLESLLVVLSVPVRVTRWQRAGMEDLLQDALGLDFGLSDEVGIVVLLRRSLGSRSSRTGFRKPLVMVAMVIICLVAVGAECIVFLATVPGKQERVSDLALPRLALDDRHRGKTAVEVGHSCLEVADNRHDRNSIRRFAKSLGVGGAQTNHIAFTGPHRAVISLVRHFELRIVFAS